MVLKATFNNISVILWRSVLLVEETGLPGENHRPAAGHLQTLSHTYNVVSSTIRIRSHNFSLIGTDCTGSNKSNCHTITATTGLHRNIRMSLRFNWLYKYYIVNWILYIYI